MEGVPRVDDQVHEDLLDLADVDAHQGQVLPQVRLERDAIADDAVQHAHRAPHHFVEVDVGQLEHLAASVGQQLLGQLGGPAAGGEDLQHVRLQGRVLGERLEEEVRVGPDDGEEVVEVVGHAPGQLADRLHPLCALELAVEVHRRFFGPLELDDLPGDIGEVADEGEVTVVVVAVAVADPEDGHDLPSPHHRDDHLADQLRVAGGQAPLVRQARVVVVDDGPALSDAVGPDPGVVEVVVGVEGLDVAEGAERAARPLLQGQGPLVGLDEVVEADGALHDLPDDVEGSGEQLGEGEGAGGFDELQAHLESALPPPRLHVPRGGLHGQDLNVDLRLPAGPTGEADEEQLPHLDAALRLELDAEAPRQLATLDEPLPLRVERVEPGVGDEGAHRPTDQRPVGRTQEREERTVRHLHVAVEIGEELGNAGIGEARGHAPTARPSLLWLSHGG
jgi:hypothetical protein